MSWKAIRSLVAGLVAAGAASATAQSTNPTPTCSDALDIEVHGQHVIGDYVTGIGHEDLDWPPGDDGIGQTVAENGGVAVRGGPGPGFHFEHGVAPGASFCTDSQSPGFPH
jgi:hypothetical protein